MVLDEKTRIDLKVNNVWAIIVSIIVSAFIVGGFVSGLNAKIDRVLVSQLEIKQDFKEWKKQAEIRLGKVEIDVAVLMDRF